MVQGGGGHTYVVNVVPRLVRLAPEIDFGLLYRSPKLEDELPVAPNFQAVKLPRVGLAGRLRHLMSGAPRLAAEWEADLYFSVSESTPPRMPCPTIASFRNAVVANQLSYRREFPDNLRLSMLHALARLAARRCERILFVSEDSARWMGEALSVPEAKRVVVHHGIDIDAWRPQVELPRPEEFPQSYMLSVSSMYRYKNYCTLISAWARLAAHDLSIPDLVIVGDDQDPPYSDEMRALHAALGPDLADRVHIVGEVPYAEVQRFYAHAELFVFPSYLEAFGHPLLEAMASGLPVVASDIPVFREIAGDAAIYADPLDPAALSDAIAAALGSLDLRDALRKRGAERVRHFTWDQSTERLAALLREQLGERRGARAA